MKRLLNDKKIAPIPTVLPKTVSGIDALYFHCKIDYTDYSQFYNNILLNNVLANDDTLKMLDGTSLDRQYVAYNYYINPYATSEASEKGRTNEVSEEIWDTFPFCQIWFKNLNKRDNLDSIKIHMNTIALQAFSIDKIYEFIQDKLFEFGLTILDTKINRLDLNTYVYDFNFDWLDYSFFSTFSRSNSKTNRNYFNRGVLQTFTVGERSSSTFYLRIYDKWNELIDLSKSDFFLSNVKRALIEQKFINLHHFLIDDNKPLWNVEYEIKRPKLKQYGINTLNDVVTFSNSLHKELTTKLFRLLSREAILGDTNKSKITTHPVWELISNTFNYGNSSLLDLNKIKAKKYEKDSLWLTNRIEEFLTVPINNDVNVNSKLKELLLLLK